MDALKYLVALVVLTGCLSPPVEKSTDERFVRIHQSDFRIKRSGHGAPTVIFESGMASGLDAWEAIPDSVSQFTTAFAYDRAGIGESEERSAKRTIPNMVEELRQILNEEEIRPPYVYAAHSMGSYIARYHAMTYPEEIAGMLLIDPSPDKLYDDYTEKERTDFKRTGDEAFAHSSSGAKREWANYLSNRAFVQGSSLTGAIPLIILSATEWDFYAYHREMMNSNEHSRHLKIEGGHGLHQEKPELIIDWVHQLIAFAGTPVGLQHPVGAAPGTCVSGNSTGCHVHDQGCRPEKVYVDLKVRCSSY